MKSVSYIKLQLFKLVIVLMVFSTPPSAAVNAGQKNVLVLHSYHRGLGWTDSISQGIDETFQKHNDRIETFTEYMDTKRIFNEQYLDRLAALLKFKYSGVRLDVIIASDDHAFHFLIKHHDSIFSGTPAIFCGVNCFKDEFIRDAPYFTGVVESFSIKETIDAAIKINPNLRRIYSIADKTVTGKANLELLKSVIPVFDSHLEFITVTDKDMTEVTDEVSRLPRDSAVLLLAFTTDRSGSFFSLEQSADLISAASSCPVYSFWDFHLNHGIVGGMLTTGVSQGTTAAQLALRILSGEAPEDIPIIKTSPNRYIFDYSTLKKFDISTEHLPPDSAVINRPPSFYEQYRGVVWQTVLVFGLLLVFTVVLTLILIRRRAAEVRLKASEEKFRNIFENSVLGCFETTPEGRFVNVNHAFARILKYNSPEDVVSRITDIGNQFYVKPEERNLYKKILEQNGKIDAFECRARCKDGNEIWISASSKAYFDKNGNVVRYEGIISDITERKRAEEEKDKFQSQLLQAQKMEAIGNLAGGIAHDFNNMLGVILGHTEIALEKTNENHDLYSNLKEIQKATQRSADLTKQLLAFARKQIIEPEILSLNQTVKHMITMLQRLIGEDIDLLWKPAENLWRVKMDPSQIDQILANLCVNARDAIAGTGKITIETGMKTFDREYCQAHPGFVPGDFVLLAVSDNGCGMDKETLKNLFEPFFTTKETGKGTGLGLATIYGIVKQNKGFINVYSEPGQGSSFKIYLPPCLSEEEPIAVSSPEALIPGGTETILLVEDDPAILDMTTMLLERTGYKVLAAGTPSEAIAFVHEHAGGIHLLMTDVVMPEMNGRDLAKHLLSLNPSLKTLFMSGYTANVIASHGELDTGVAFLQKPFSMADLAVKVREVLDKKVE